MSCGWGVAHFLFLFFFLLRTSPEDTQVEILGFLEWSSSTCTWDPPDLLVKTRPVSSCGVGGGGIGVDVWGPSSPSGVEECPETEAVGVNVRSSSTVSVPATWVGLLMLVLLELLTLVGGGVCISMSTGPRILRLHLIGLMHCKKYFSC